MYSKFTFPQHSQHPSSVTSFAILEFTVSHPHLWNVCIFASCPHRTLLHLPIWPFHYPPWFLSRSMCRLLGSWHSMFVFFSQVFIHDRESCLLVSGQQNHSVNACWTLCKKKLWYWINISKRSKSAPFSGNAVCPSISPPCGTPISSLKAGNAAGCGRCQGNRW